MNHIGDVNKLVSDTPRTDEELVEMTTGHGPVVTKTTWVHSSLCFQLERELNDSNDRIRLLIAERDTARRQADQTYKLRKEFAELLGTDDVDRGVAVVRDMKQRISKLYDYVAALETAGDEMANELSYGYDVDMWNKAKEAKP